MCRSTKPTAVQHVHKETKLITHVLFVQRDVHTASRMKMNAELCMKSEFEIHVSESGITQAGNFM